MLTIQYLFRRCTHYNNYFVSIASGGSDLGIFSVAVCLFVIQKNLMTLVLATCLQYGSS